MITSAPRARSNRAFSCDILSGIVKMQRYPFTAATRARPTPVLPDVASTIRPPGLRRPSRSAASIIARPMRSLTDPPGLKNSALAYTGVRIPRVTWLSRISGVQPIVSRTLSYGLVCCGTRVRSRLGRVGPRLGRVGRRRRRRRWWGLGRRRWWHRPPCCIGACGVGSWLRRWRCRRPRCGLGGWWRRRGEGRDRLRRRRWGGRQRHGARARGPYLPEFDRLQKGGRDCNAVSLARSKAKPRRSRNSRRVERGKSAGLGDPSGLRDQPARRVHKEPQRDVPFHLLFVQRRWIGDRHIRVERDRRLRLGKIGRAHV